MAKKKTGSVYVYEVGGNRADDTRFEPGEVVTESGAELKKLIDAGVVRLAEGE